MKFTLISIAMAALTACASANANGGGATLLPNATTCGDDLCVIKQFLTDSGYTTAGIQKDGKWASCYQVAVADQSLARTAGENRARAQLQAFLANTEIAQWIEKDLKVTFVAGYQKGIGAEKLVPYPINNSKAHIVCVLLKQVNN